MISALVILGLNAGMAYEHVHSWHANRSVAATFIADGLPLLDAFTSNAAIAMIVAAGAIGTLAVTGEYGTGLIRTTFSAIPARRSVMAAKVSVIAAVTTVFGAVVAAASFGLTQAILSGQHAGVSPGYPGAWWWPPRSLRRFRRWSAPRSARSSGTAPPRWGPPS